MSEPKFTAGPWEIDRNGSATTIYEIGPLRADEYAGCSWLEVTDADARLIAAAPELYAFAAAQLAEMDFRADPAEREKRAELFSLLRRVQGEA